MATTTPNFGWAVPTSSDLVKNGATAIETLGDAIDASLVDLKGGTTGQVLTKASDTDMDFSWSAASAGSSNVAGKNGVLNSNFSIWQRGTSAALGGAGVVTSADRWATYTGGNGTMSRQATNDSTNLPNIQYCARIQRNSGETSTAQLQVGQSFETINSIPYAGKTVTLSFYARAGANYSPTSGAFLAYVKSGTGTDQNLVLTGYTGSVTTASTTATLTTTWQRFTVSGTVATNATELGVEFRFTPTGTAGANDYAEVTGVQLEIASSASAYSPNAPTYQAELAACQRYYWRTSNSGVNNANLGGTGFSYSTSAGAYWVNNPVAMRVAPTAIDAANLRVYDITGAAVYTATATISTDSTPINGVMNFAVTGITANRVVRLDANTTGGYLGFSAEL